MLSPVHGNLRRVQAELPLNKVVQISRASSLAILAGAVILSWEGYGVSLNSGALLVAGACLAWRIDNNLTRKLSSADPVLIAMTKGLVAGAVNVALAILRGATLPSIEVSGGAAVVGFLGVGVSLVLFILALRHLGTARTGAYFSLLHDPLSVKLVLSGALMGFGYGCILLNGMNMNTSTTRSNMNTVISMIIIISTSMMGR
jgi:hypothetical protein